MAEQAGLGICVTFYGNPEDRFSHVEAQIVISNTLLTARDTSL